MNLWDVERGTLISLFMGSEGDARTNSLAFAPDGKTLFTGNGNASCYQLDVGRLAAGH